MTMQFNAIEYISPLILAAKLNQFDRLKELLDQGLNIEKPHHLPCWCLVCKSAGPEEQLEQSQYRIEVYKALTSPAWLCLTASDPILEAFKLSDQLASLAKLEVEFKDFYLDLSKKCQTYTCDLLQLCRSSEEVIAILNREENEDMDQPLQQQTRLGLSRLKLAIKYRQKWFIAHPHCQQLLTSIWFEGFPGRQERGSILNVLICGLLMIGWPILPFCYIVAPKSRIGQIVQSPFMKFLYNSTSFGIFLCLLTIVSVRNKSLSQDEVLSRASSRGPSLYAEEWLILLFVLGMLWTEMDQIWDEGLEVYAKQWWNYLDFTMLSLYLCTFALRAVAIYYRGNDDITTTGRYQWNWDEPLLISEGLFAVVNVLSFARILFLFQTNPYLGPLQISLGCMILDIVKFFFIFFLVLTSFAFGLHQLYLYSSHCPNGHNTSGDQLSTNMMHCQSNIGAFRRIEDSYLTLLWSLFSITNQKATDVAELHYFTEWIGRGLYICYHVMSIVVLLNMLIAMMSYSFQRINENSDLEWKYHRSKLWMSYFDDGTTLHPPFSILVFPIRVGQFLLQKVISGRSLRNNSGRKKTGAEEQQNTENDGLKKLWRRHWRKDQNHIPTYRDIINRLVQRYVDTVKENDRNIENVLELQKEMSEMRTTLNEVMQLLKKGKLDD